MTVNRNPVFPADPILGFVTIATANTGLDGSGTIEEVYEASLDGARISRVVVKAAETTTQGKVRLFLSPDAGTTWELWQEIDVTAATPDATVSAFVAELAPNNGDGLDLPAGWSLGAATHNAETFNVFACGGAF